ncbi:MAG TPA: ABC transporter ATP-binding protein [Acidimicrobiales bacterium]|nr:ABC transporter ATP-binding protein [Acidimicrobiales bacterium]
MTGEGGPGDQRAVSVRGLAKTYDGHTFAVDGIDLDVDRGAVHAVLGPNGAGKTTLVEILEGYRKRTRGQVSVLGMDPEHGGRRFRERIGIVLQESGIEPALSVTEVLRMRAPLYPDPLAVTDVIEMVGLEEKSSARVRTLSGGQKRRLDMALGLVGNPELLFLDEPTTGFDPSARRESWETIRSLCGLGKTVLLTTHYMDEAQALADQLTIVARGRVVARGTPDAIGDRAHGTARVTFTLPVDGALDDLPVPFLVEDGRVVVECRPDGPQGPTAVLHRLTGWALERGIELDALSVIRPSLEDVYLELTGAAGGGEGAERGTDGAGAGRR